MDPEYASSDDEAEAMAKQMGFSSFGTQGPTRKRKFNPSTDAMVEGQELALLNKGGKKGQGSGGNTIPLGKTRLFGEATSANADEISLEDEEVPEPDSVDTSLPPPQEQDTIEDEDLEPAYIDTSLPPPNEDAWALQEKINDILAQNPPISPGLKASGKPPIPDTSRGIGRFVAAIKESPRQPYVGLASSTASVTPTTNSQRPRERGQINHLWYVGYYDHSFNENPWANLESAKGLPPRGTWVARDVRS